MESGQSRLRFESADADVKRLETEIGTLRETLQTKRTVEHTRRAHANQLRGEQAALEGRRDALNSLIRNHGYATDTVRCACSSREHSVPPWRLLARWPTSLR